MVKVKSSVSNKPQTLLRSIFIVLPFLFCSSLVSAQTGPLPRSTPPPPRIEGTKSPEDSRPLTTFEEELKAKRAIKLAEKDHEENLNRARELAQLGKELCESLKNKASVYRANCGSLGGVVKERSRDTPASCVSIGYRKC